MEVRGSASDAISVPAARGAADRRAARQQAVNINSGCMLRHCMSRTPRGGYGSPRLSQRRHFCPCCARGRRSASSAAAGSEYQFGLHAQALYEQNTTRVVWKSAAQPATPFLSLLRAGPQLYDFTQQGSIWPSTQAQG